MTHTVLRVKTTSGEGSVFIAAIIATVPAIRIMDALIVVNSVIIKSQWTLDMSANHALIIVNNVWIPQHAKSVKMDIMWMMLAKFVSLVQLIVRITCAIVVMERALEDVRLEVQDIGVINNVQFTVSNVGSLICRIVCLVKVDFTAIVVNIDATKTAKQQMVFVNA